MNDAALSKWYAAHSLVRRLWAFRNSEVLRVVVTLAPTHDGDDISPAWLATGRQWARELQLLADAPVQLEVLDEAQELEAGFDGVLVAEVSWRDSSVAGEAPPIVAFATFDDRP